MTSQELLDFWIKYIHLFQEMARRPKTLTNELKTLQKGEIMKVGFLSKKGHVRRNWLDRWFVLTTEGLYYYKNRSVSKLSM